MKRFLKTGLSQLFCLLGIWLLEENKIKGGSMLYLANTFTLGMLKGERGEFRYERIDLEEAQKLIAREGRFVSAVGHKGTAELMSELLKVEVPFNRIQIAVNPGDKILVCQLLVRLPEGAVLSYEEMVRLYEEGKIAFYLVEAK